MSWTAIRGHRPAGNEQIPCHKCSCGAWYTVIFGVWGQALLSWYRVRVLSQPCRIPTRRLASCRRAA